MQQIMSLAQTRVRKNFGVNFGMLSYMGMRQRYLLGRYNRKRYDKLLKNSKALFVQSTDVYRTIQSAYAELQGMYHEDLADMYKSKRGLFGLKKGQESGGRPEKLPFKVRRVAKIDSDVGGKMLAAPQGFMPVPVYVHMGSSDGVSCRAAKERSLKYRRDMTIYN